MKLQIQTGLNNKILRKKAEEIKNISDEKEFIEELKKFLKKSDDWVWVASPQVWFSKRIFLAQFDKKNTTVVINPKILKFSEKKVVWKEWCLSLPWIFWDVERSKKIVVEYFNENWKKIKMELKWFWAIVFQHEFDHLEGVLFFDKLVNWEFEMDKKMTEKDLEKLWIKV